MLLAEGSQLFNVPEVSNEAIRLRVVAFTVVKEPPTYKVLHEEGPTHDRTFTIGILDISGNVIASSSAKNKKIAEQDASRLALEVLKEK